MNREAQAAVMFLLGVALLRASATGLYLRYVKAGLHPLLIAAGVVLVLAAAATVWYDLWRPRAVKRRQPEGPRSENVGHGHDGHDGHGHGHGHHEPRISWLLALPLLALILVSPPPLGSYSAGRTGTGLRPPWGFPALPASRSLRLEVNDYAARAVYDHGRALAGRRITMTGFVTVDRGGGTDLTRMVISCCAADAQPVKVRLSGKLPPIVQPDTWLNVNGTYLGRRTKDPINDGSIPFFRVSRSEPVPAPKDPYEAWEVR